MSSTPSVNRIVRPIKYQCQSTVMTMKTQNLRAELVLILKIRLLQLIVESDITQGQLAFNTAFTLYQTRGKVVCLFLKKGLTSMTHYCPCYWVITLLYFCGLAGVVTSTCHCFQLLWSDETWCKIMSHLLN